MINSLKIERMELFFDIYGNNLIKEKSAEFIDRNIKDLVNLICDREKHSSDLKQIFDFSELKFKDIDQIVEIIESWNSKNPFNIKELRLNCFFF